MASEVTNVIIAGLGGQGVLRASDILAEAAFRSGGDVKKSEVHGMSQRGGSVNSGIRFGVSVLSPMVPVGEADYLVVLDESQIEINRHVLSSGGCLIAPEAVAGVELPNKRSLNVALLGVLSTHLDIGVDLWRAAIRAGFKESLHEVNLEAFDAGRAGGA
jgi:indolepyruvate ferredoxin oxidoreductase, beta subunit